MTFPFGNEYDPHEDWGDDDFGSGDYDWDEDAISRIPEMQEESYSRTFDTENPSSSNLRWNDAALEKLLGGVGYGVMSNMLDDLRDFANNESITDGAVYGSAVHTEEDRHGTDFAPGGYVYTKNYEARLDEAYHGTLLKVLGQAQTLLARTGTSGTNPGLPPGITMTRDKSGRTRYRGAGGRFVKNPFS